MKINKPKWLVQITNNSLLEDTAVLTKKNKEKKRNCGQETLIQK